MVDENPDWNDLAAMWRAEGAGIPIEEIESHARRERMQMSALAFAEAMGLAAACLAALWLVLQANYVVLSAIVLAMNVVTAFVAWRLRRDPEPAGGADLLSALATNVAREEWNVTQLRIGRGVNFLTLFAVLMALSTRLRYFATTPTATFATLFAVGAIVLAVLAWNLLLTRRARERQRRLESYATRLRAGPESNARRDS